MPSKTASRALVDIVYNIALATDWTRGLTLQDFEGDLLTFYATTRALEIVSEATRRSPDDLLLRHPDIPWRDVRDAGNFYRNKYDRVVEEYVWSTVMHSLPPLLAVARSELDRLDRISQDSP